MDSHNQRKYALDILTYVGGTGVKPAKFPLPKGLKLSTKVGQWLTDPKPYRRLICRRLYLTLTRPNCSYGVQHLSQFILTMSISSCYAHYQISQRDYR